MPKYVLIEVDEFLDEEFAGAQDLADYLVNELDNKAILNGSLRGFESITELYEHVRDLGQAAYNIADITAAEGEER